MKRPVLLFVLCLILTTIPVVAEETEIEPAPGQSVMTLEEYLKQGGEEWFLTGKKEYSVQGMMVSEVTTFHNELEAADYTVTDDDETVILKGLHDEMWATKLPKVIAAYTKPDGTGLSEDDFEKKDEWIEIITRPEPNSYYAMYVPLDVSVTVETAWGDELHTNLPNAPHGDGDYLICRTDEDGEPDLSDVWVLNGVIFPEYYERAYGVLDELPPRSQFSMLSKPALSIKYKEFTCNMTCIRLFEGVRYVLPIVNPIKKRFAIVPCAEEESSSVEWARQKDEKWTNKTVTLITKQRHFTCFAVGNQVHCYYSQLISCFMFVQNILRYPLRMIIIKQ